MNSETTSPLATLARGIWWFVLLRGALAIIFGFLALVAPAAALVGITIVFGVYALVDGIAEIVQSVRMRRHDQGWGWLLFQGIVSVLAGLAAIIMPSAAGIVGGLFVLWIIVIYALVHGVLGLVSAAGVGGTSAKKWGILSAVMTLLFAIVLGIVVLVSPGASVLGLIWVVGVYAVAFGIMLVIAAFMVRRIAGSRVQ